MVSCSTVGGHLKDATEHGGFALTTFLLVHGAWHGGWCWSRVARILRAAGHDVHTPTLTGLGDRTHLMSRSVNLETHVQDVLNLLHWEELSDVVLCGHSYGGMVITGVADRAASRIRSLVYLDAFVPENGQSVLDILSADRVAQIYDGVRANGAGWLMPPRPAALFDVNEADQAWVDRLCVLHPVACFEQKLLLSGAFAQAGKRTYIQAAGYTRSAFGPIADRLRRDKGWTVTSLPCGHDVMVDMPGELAELLINSA
jgi:pimeloyl-ACP methyl ester carboxylesterase